MPATIPRRADRAQDHPGVLADRSRVRDGALADLKAAMADLVAFIRANEPDIGSYDVYFDAAGEVMTVVHTLDDQSSLEHHMEVAGPKFPPIGEYLELQAIDVYGHLTDDLVREFREKATTLAAGR